MSRRDELLAAIQDRLVLVTSRNDPSPVLDRSALAQARDLAACLTDATDLAAERALGYFYYFRSTGLRRGRAEQELSAALRHFRMPFMTGTGTLPPALMASLAERAIPDARDLVRRTLSDTDPGLAQFAVDLTRRITRHLPDNHRAYPLVHGLLGTLLDTRFQRGGDLTDVNGAIAAGRIAARTGSRHSLFHGNLCGALVNRYQRTGDLSDVNEAVQSGRTAVKFADANDADRFGYLTNLGAALRMRFLRTHDLADADEAVDLSRSAARGIDADDPRRALFLSNLGVALQSRFGRTGALADIDEAVEVNRRAIQADPTYVGALSNLCLVLLNRYQRTGDLKDADEAVAAARAALHILPDDHPTRAVPWLSLSSALRFRFQGTGMLSDVNEAVAAGQAAVRATPDNHAERAARQANLAACLRMRFERTGDLADVDEAVRLGRSVLRDLPADHPTRAQHLAEFAAALQMRFEHVKDLADLDEAIEASRGAIRTAAADQHRTMPLTNLCIGLWMRFQHTRDPRDADAAAQAGRDALRLMPADHPNRAGILINLAQALQLRSAQDGSHTDTTEEQSAWEEAAASRTAPPRLRVRAARNAARLAAPSDPGRAAAFLEQAVLLLPQVAPRRLRRSDQQYFLATDTIDLAADAAALALADPAGTASERAARALRLAEAGRAVLLSQALDTRDDLSELRARHPRMATRFTELRGLLDQDQGQFAGAELPPGSDAGRERHLLVSELEELTTRIRGQADFASFGLPPTIEDLLAEAAHGPVVTFNISRYRSDALLLTGKGITSCPLPRLTHDRVSAQVDSFYQALDEAWAPDGDRIAAQRTLRGVLEWLWEAAAEPVLTALAATLEEAHGTPPGGMLPRVW
ncbi:tetratricopeptide repeat protein, partial [Streptomyces sp. NPDC059900]